MNKFITSKIDSKYFGILSGVISALSYAFYPALIFVLIKTDAGLSNMEKVALGFAVVAVKETFTFFISVLFSPKVYFTKTLWNSFKTKWGWLSIAAGLFGGPIGYSLLTVASIFIGAATPDAINLGMMLIFTTLLERFLLKRKVNILFIIGSMIVLFGCIGLVAGQGMSINENDKTRFIIGFLFAIGAAISWSLENILADYVLTKNNVGITSKNFLGIKLFSSAALALPIAVIVSYITTHSSFGVDRYAEFYTNWRLTLSMLAVAVFIFLARIFYFISIKLSTSKTTSALQTLQLIFAPILIIIVGSIAKASIHQADYDAVKSWWFWVSSIVILFGISVTNIEKDKFLKLFKKKKDDDTLNKEVKTEDTK